MSKKPSIPLSEYKSANFDYKQLTEFNPGLVYGFECEASVQRYHHNSIEYSLHGRGQYQDVFDAYLYAQNEILPIIRQQGIDKITSDQLVEWINQIHKRIANTLAQDQRTKAGEHTKEQIIRWHYPEPSPGVTTHTLVVAYLSEMLAPNIDLLTLAKQAGANPKITADFLKLLVSIRDNQSLSLTAEQKSMSFDPDYHVGQKTIYKLVNLYHSGKLTAEQLKIVHHLVAISPAPAQLSKLMKDFSEQLLAKWQKCDKNNKDQVAELGFFAFYHLTEIHPFFNCNGRTATCLLNVILRSLNQPSILMRYPNEADDDKSSYSQAIGNIHTKPQLLVQHIKARLNEPTPFQNDKLAIIIAKRVEFANKLINLKQYYSATQLNTFYLKWIHTALYSAIPLTSSASTTEDFTIQVISRYCGECDKLLQAKAALASQSAAASFTSATPTSAAVVSPVVQYQYNESDKKAILTKLQSLTGQGNWKTYKEKEATVVLLTMNQEQKPLAAKIVNALQKTESLQAKLMKEPGSNKPVIKLTEIQSAKLLKIASLPDLTMNAASIDQVTSHLEQLNILSANS